jgi:hypothetical protein
VEPKGTKEKRKVKQELTEQYEKKPWLLGRYGEKLKN